MIKNIKYIFLVISQFLLINIAFAQPVNDNCANATLLTVNAAPLCGQTTAAATTQGGETKPCGATGAQTVWYRFVATQANMSVWVDNLASGGCHIASGVWNTGTCFPVTTLSCKAAAAPTDIWHHLTGLTVGNTYLISVVYGNGGVCGASQTFCISVVAPPQTSNYTHPTTGINGTYVGSCMVNTCSGNYFDNGGPGGSGTNNAAGNYSNGINSIYRVFCPNSANNCVRATVFIADFEAGFDGLIIRNGPTQNSPTIVTLSNAGNGTYTSTDASGCLTFQFISDATINRAGFAITLSCVACAGPSGLDNNDCALSTQLCSNATINAASTGPGLNSESCLGCTAGGENYSNWYTIGIATNGNLSLTIDPNVNTDDYDFALYGPFNVYNPSANCAVLGTPIRCSYAATGAPGNTGMGNGAADFSEGVTGDSWVATLAVTAGQVYYLMVNKWDPTPGNGYQLQWTGGAGGSSTATISCTVLPVDWRLFTAELVDSKVQLNWSTATENNTSHYAIERTVDGEVFEEIGKVNAKGTSIVVSDYSFTDNYPVQGISYYRIKQVDIDGNRSYSVSIPIRYYSLSESLSVSPNPNNGNARVRFACNQNENALLEVFDSRGQLLINEQLNCNAGDNVKEIDLSNFPNGFYYVSVSNAKGSARTKLLKGNY